MQALRKAQFLYDNAEPHDDSAAYEAAQAWIEGSADQLVRGCDVLIPQRFGGPVGVTHDQLIRKVQEHLVQRQIDGLDDEDWFAQIVMEGHRGVNVKGCAERLLGPCSHPFGKVHELAEELLEPFAELGMQHEAEEAQL